MTKPIALTASELLAKGYSGPVSIPRILTAVEIAAQRSGPMSQARKDEIAKQASKFTYKPTLAQPQPPPPQQTTIPISTPKPVVSEVQHHHSSNNVIPPTPPQAPVTLAIPQALQPEAHSIVVPSSSSTLPIMTTSIVIRPPETNQNQEKGSLFDIIMKLFSSFFGR